MKLPYSLIFRDAAGVEDSQIIGCGLNSAYIRFLFSVGDFPHSFWDEDEKVILSDGEQQLLESGKMALSNFFINGGCSMLVTKATIPGSLSVPENQVITVPFGDVNQNTDYVIWSPQGELGVLKTGLYGIFANTRNHGPLTTASDFWNFIRPRVNGVSQSLYDVRIASGQGETLSLNFPASLQEGDEVIFEYLRGGSGDVYLNPDGTQVRIMFYG